MKRGRTAALPARILQGLTQLQDGLNALVDPSWREVRCLDDWSLAITMESTELLDSYPWKWWKNLNAKPDIDNIKIELVDIFHFSLSGGMQLKAIPQAKVPAIASKPIDEAIVKCVPKSGDALSSGDGLAFFPLSTTQNAIATFRNVIQLTNVYRFDTITEMVVMAAEDLGFNLVAYYVAKHTLNYLRQCGGYKDGTYKKVNHGVEDNVLLHDCVKHVTIEKVLGEDSYETVWNDIMTKVYDAFQVAPADRKDVKYWMSRAEAKK